MQIDRKKLMQTAWATARRRAETFGTTSRGEFKLALRHAWADARKDAAVADAVANEVSWAPTLAGIAAREAAGTPHAADTELRILAARSIFLMAEMVRCAEIQARFA